MSKHHGYEFQNIGPNNNLISIVHNKCLCMLLHVSANTKLYYCLLVLKVHHDWHVFSKGFSALIMPTYELWDKITTILFVPYFNINTKFYTIF